MRPHEDHTRFQGLDVPEYDVPSTCQVPGCINARASKHHIWSRTAIRRRGGGGWPAIVDTETGDVLKNLAAVCAFHDEMLHRTALAEIKYDAYAKCFYWVDQQGQKPLRLNALLSQASDSAPEDACLAEAGTPETDGSEAPAETPPAPPASQPETAGGTADAVASSDPSLPTQAPPREDSGASMTGTPSRGLGAGAKKTGQPAPTPTGDDHAALAPGEKCPTCERRVPHQRKPSSPQSKPKAFRVPADEVEVFNETLEAVEELVGVASQPFSSYKAIVAALAYVLQEPDEVREFLTRRAA